MFMIKIKNFFKRIFKRRPKIKKPFVFGYKHALIITIALIFIVSEILKQRGWGYEIFS